MEKLACVIISAQLSILSSINKPIFTSRNFHFAEWINKTISPFQEEVKVSSFSAKHYQNIYSRIFLFFRVIRCKFMNSFAVAPIFLRFMFQYFSMTKSSSLRGSWVGVRVDVTWVCCYGNAWKRERGAQLSPRRKSQHAAEADEDVSHIYTHDEYHVTSAHTQSSIALKKKNTLICSPSSAMT